MNPWQAVARLGEAQILLPALTVVCAWLAWHGGAARTAAWTLGLAALATAATTATKVAFIGFEVGCPPWDYTGIAGHSMFAAAAWPVLVGLALPPGAVRWRVAALGSAYALAGIVSVSRVVTGAHSPSEVVLGFLLGAAASALALRLGSRPRVPVPKALLVALLAWMLAAPAGAPPSRTHGWVTALALKVSGRDRPYTREMMLARWLAQQPARAR